MYPILFAPDATSWDTFGIGVLSDAISCEVEENRNGAYELEMTYPITGAHFDDIALRCLVLAKPNYTDNPQPFRIYAISKPLNGIVTVNAQHISYDLSGYVDAPFTAADIQIALGKIVDQNIVYPYPCPFTFSTDITSMSVMTLKHPQSIRALMGGTEGSFIDTYGGEWHFDGYNCEMKNARGANRGVVIRYGKNLTDLKQEENNASVYTAVYPYYWNADNETLVTLPEKVISVTGSFSYTRILPLDLSYSFEETPNQTQLRAKAQSYIDDNDVGIPKINLTISFLEADSIAERVDLCDTVSVSFDTLGVTASAKCIRTRWDVLKGRYIEAELGSSKGSLAESIANSAEVAKVIDERTSQFQTIASGVVSKVTGNQGGYIVLHDTNNDGEPDEILIMDDDDINQAVNIIRMNNGGIAFSNSGYTGTYTTAWNIDGEFVADFIAAGELKTDLVTVLGDTQFYWDSNNITIIDPQNSNRMIRFGKYDGTNYGLGFTVDGGTTWKSGFSFDGIKMIGDADNAGYVSMDGDSFDIYNASGVSLAHLGIGTVNGEDGTIKNGPYYRLGTYSAGASHGEYCFSAGRFSNPNGAHCVCVGYSNQADGVASIALGKQNTSVNETCVAIGIGNTATGVVDETVDNVTKKVGGVAIGHYSKADAGAALAFGCKAHAKETWSVAIGTDASALIWGSIAIGYGSYANGASAVAIGSSANAKVSSVAIGDTAEAKGAQSVAIGSMTEARGDLSIVVGYGGIASGERACVIGGEDAKASGDYSLSSGFETTVSGNHSTGFGQGVKATSNYQFVCGRYNEPGAYRFIVGNGTADNARSNALRLSTAGNLWIAGTLTQGSDAKQKDVIGEVPDMSGIRAVRFRWNSNKKNHDDIEHIGYLAQDVEKVAPYLIEEDENSGYKSLNYIEFLCAKIDSLERTVERLANRVAALEGVTA